jgi:hypothetical protein
MAGFGVQERMERASKPCINTCGACDAEIGRGEILCQSCKNEVLYGMLDMGKVTAHSKRG